MEGEKQMSEQERAQNDKELKKALVELEDRLMGVYAQAELIRAHWGIRFIRLDPSWTMNHKPGLQAHCGIIEAAAVLGKEITIKKDFGREEATFVHRGCVYSQLPEYDGPRYRRAWEK